ncbi:MAG: DegT/DnrJ/EryC1/StrS family aminotransferase [Alphaproteobacteria bacterium]|nr:DegT/DnrJ/EryC1/StrS family aminotransferase [Alphaproteobacteria bacterium]
MAIPFLDLPAQHVALKQELMRVFSDALDSAGFIGGPVVKDFEEDFSAFVGAKYAVGVANGTDALRLALIAMGVKAGDRVVTVPNTFIATTEAISQAGAKIDFVDVDPDTCLMDPNRLEAYLKRKFSGTQADRPSAIIPVHLYGQCADMDAILSLARQYNLIVLEDAAQAHGATYKGKAAGTMGHAAAFSFYPGKNLGACGDAGVVTTNDPAIAEKLAMLRDHGQKTKYYHAVEGCNGRLDAIQAGFLRVKLPHLAMWNNLRRQIAEAYDSAFGDIDWIRLVKVHPYNVSSCHLYVIHSRHRDQLQEHLKNNGIATGMHYPLPLHLQKCYAHLGFKHGSFPEAERSGAELLSLPMFPELGIDRARQVIDSVLAFSA